MTLSGCLSRGSRGRACFVLCVIYVQSKEIYIILGFDLHEICLLGVVRHRGLCEAGKAVWVRLWGVWFMSAECYLQISVFAGNGFGFS